MSVTREFIPSDDGLKCHQSIMFLWCASSSTSYVCSKMQVGHAHYSDSIMGYFVVKRILCTELSSGGFQCSTYKVPRAFSRTLLIFGTMQLGICMQNVGVNLWVSNANHDKAVMKQWVQAAMTIVENNGDLVSLSMQIAFNL